MQVAPGVEMLELTAVMMNGPGALFPTLLWDEKDAVLVDAGLPDMAPKFVTAIARTGVSFEKLGRIIITHHDLDHIGSLRELQQTSPRHIEVLSHADEVPYIQGERPPIKTTPEMLKQMEEQMKNLPDERRKGMMKMMERMGKQKLRVDRTLGDGEELPYCGGIGIIHTPGHTPGHICLYHKPSKTLIAGDALFVDNGKLVPAQPYINSNPGMAIASIQKLSGHDIANVIAYHGGLFRNDPNKRIAEIAQSNY